MTLPNYFLADLPPGAELRPSMLQEACDTLKRNRRQYLAGRSTLSLIRLFDELARAWLDPQFPFRALALDQGPAATGFTKPILAKGLDAFFSELTGDKMEQWITAELGHLHRLDEAVATDAERSRNRAAFAAGPEFLVHIAGGQIPTPVCWSIALGFLVRSAQFVKCASGRSLIPRLFAHSLYDAEPKLGACLEIAEWKGGTASLDSVLFDAAHCVTATGEDETIAAIRGRLPSKTRLLAYGHRLSFGYITQEALSGYNPKQLIADAAEDVVAWDQLGCLSPHLFFVESGGRLSSEEFAEGLAAELARREHSEPRGPIPPETAAAIASRRAFYEIRAAHSLLGARHWFSPDSTAWTVIYEEDSRFELSCLNRFIYVKGIRGLNEVLQTAELWRGRISTIGLAAPEPLAKEIVPQLAQWGVTRVCPLGRMQRPPLFWRHDGRPALGDLVTWTDWEK